ncbi:hypothetical protein [Flavobacterium hydatis]|uniref:Uncharacterized protein n=1 Tax=Flavobacterium hydatis TaxID=991 RepID=A0A086AIP3_FLAHY|nr:hypothetical protein [Flavobacterium hydatis]KFF16557.1 hypothetical protein IW20_10335 [Flavobacterium hydatis]OXA90216.1 hypothetical protein B0A62_19270 [Flavobacterium hydatis]
MKKDKHKEKTEKKKKKPIPHRPEEEKKKKIKKDNKRKAPFMQVDRGGNIFTNFFSNFLRQLKNPTNTGLGRLLDKLLFIKIKENENKPAEKPEKLPDIMGPVKTVLRYIDNSGNNNLTPSEKESLRQRTNQSVNIKPEQRNEEIINEPRKPRLRM